MTPINPPYDDAAKNIAVGISERIKKHHFTFISAAGKSFSLGENVSFEFSPFQGPGRHKMSLLQKIYIFFISVFRISRIDCFQFFFNPQTYFSFVFRIIVSCFKKYSVQIVTSVHSLIVNNQENKISKLFFADSVVVMSDFAKERLNLLGVRNVKRIYPGVDLKRFNPDGLPKVEFNCKNIIYPGTYRVLSDYYSLSDFLQIALKVVDKVAGVKFVMACRIRTRKEMRLENEFRKLVENAGLSKNFVFIGTSPDMPGLFNNSALGVFPLREPMTGILEIPLVMLELSCMEKPVVYNNIPGFNELAEKNIGVMLKNCSPQAYADEILLLLTSDSLREDIGKKSREAVLKYFDMDLTAKEFAQIYDSFKRSSNAR